MATALGQLLRNSLKDNGLDSSSNSAYNTSKFKESRLQQKTKIREIIIQNFVKKYLPHLVSADVKDKYQIEQ